MTGEQRFPEDRVKHLEMIQAVIARLGSDSFVVKGWAVAVSGVFLGFAVSNEEPLLAMLSVIPTLMFWLLDTYYLRAERLFRMLYDRTRQLDRDDYEPFAMDATASTFIQTLSIAERKKASGWRIAFSRTLLWLYAALTLAAGGVTWIAHAGAGNASESSKRVSHVLGHPGKHH